MRKSIELGPVSCLPCASGLRRAAAVVLRGASRQLARLARRLAAASPDAAKRRRPVLEFHAEPGAAQGALYVDGEFVGHLPGVTRL